MSLDSELEVEILASHRKLRNLQDQHDAKVRDVRHLCASIVFEKEHIQNLESKLYTIDSKDEREVLDKTEVALQELRDPKVQHEVVCKCFCTSPEKAPATKLKKTPIKTGTTKEIFLEQKKLKNTVADLQDKVFGFEKRSLIKTVKNEMEVRKGILK